MKKTKDIFISYKRSDGKTHAKYLYKELISLGYSVFLDTEVLQNGKYEPAILERIKNSTDFIIIVTPDFADDTALLWIKKEVDCALQFHCNIVPIYYTNPENIGANVRVINEYNGINARDKDYSAVTSLLAGTFLQSNPDISFKEDPQKDDLSNLKDYLHKHTTNGFMEFAMGAYADGQIHDSNYSLALLAQESDYDIISCLWVIMFKCNRMLDKIPDNVIANFDFLKSLLGFVETMLADCAILVDEGKLDTANRFLPECRDLLFKIIDGITSDELDE